MKWVEKFLSNERVCGALYSYGASLVFVAIIIGSARLCSTGTFLSLLGLAGILDADFRRLEALRPHKESNESPNQDQEESR